eukprot:92134-Hanusia_phi.AAC.1
MSLIPCHCKLVLPVDAFIAFFILLNVLLAILVDAYAKVKGETEGTTGLGDELVETVWHGVRRVLGFQQFVSNQMMEATLVREREMLKSMESHRRNIERDMEEEKLILLPGGISLDTYELAALARQALGKTPDQGHTNCACSDYLLDEDEIVASADLMDRYGTEPTEIAEKRKHELIDLYDMEGVRRQIAMQIGQVKILSIQKRMSDVITRIGKELVPAAMEETAEKAEVACKPAAPT